jgi:hypothetical protein
MRLRCDQRPQQPLLFLQTCQLFLLRARSRSLHLHQPRLTCKRDLKCENGLQGGRCTHNFDVVKFVNEDTFRITMIACGDLHCLALSCFGKQMYSWGCAANGRLGYEVL